MLSTPEQIADFKTFYNAGGLDTAANLIKGQSLASQTASLSGSYGATVESEADYTADGVESLPAAIQAIVSATSSATSMLEGWNAYITTASDPFDLAQVSAGATIYRKVMDQEDTSPWGSLPPMSSKSEIAALEVLIDEVGGCLAQTQSLMAEIHESLLPPPTEETDPESGDTIEVETPPDPLTQPQIDACLALAADLEPFGQSISDAVGVMSSMVSSASGARGLALDYFKKASQFTVCSNQMRTDNIKDGTREIFSIG